MILSTSIIQCIVFCSGADVDQAFLLHWASSKGHKDIVELLLKYKADVNIEDQHGNTPLIKACRGGHSKIVEILLKRYSFVIHF